MTAQPDPTATTAFQIRAVLFNKSVRITDAQLLVLVLGMGTTRHGKGQVKKTWTGSELANDLLTEAGGRLEHLVASVRRDDFDLRHFGLGKALGSRLLAAMELAYRWGRGFERAGDLRVRWDSQGDLIQSVLERDVRLTEGELMAVLWGRYRAAQKEVIPLLANYSNAEILMQALTPTGFEQARRAGTWVGLWRGYRDDESSCRLLAAIELARRHRERASFERYTLKPETFGLSSAYLIKLLHPESPLDRPTRQRLLANVRSNPRMEADFTQLDRLAYDAKTDDPQQAIKVHVMFEALCKNRQWTHPAEVLGEPVPYRTLLSIAEANIARAESATRSARVKELLAAAELAATRKPLTAFVARLVELGVSESGLARAFDEARRRLGEVEANRS